MSEQKLPDFMQKYADYMDDGHLEMYKLAAEYYDMRTRAEVSLSAGGPNNELRRKLYNDRMEALKKGYEEKAVILARKYGLTIDQEKEISDKEKGQKTKKNISHLDNEQLTTEEKKEAHKENSQTIGQVDGELQKFLAEIREAKERNRESERER